MTTKMKTNSENPEKRKKTPEELKKIAAQKELFRQELLKHKESYRKTMNLVEKYSEEQFRVEEFLNDLRWIDPTFYQDIVEERSGNNVCGYALCGESVNTHSSKFRISCSFNKVFEVDERNKYCSDVCYRRSTFVAFQLDESPLWLRDEAKMKKDEIELLWDDIGLPGTEIVFENLECAEHVFGDEGGPRNTDDLLANVMEDLQIISGAPDENVVKVKAKTTNEKRDVDLRSMYLKFISEWLKSVRTFELSTYLGTGSAEEELDSDDEELPEEVKKFVPKSNRKEIIREKKQVPSFVELSDEINRLRIYEYLNPKISESQKVSGASAIKSNVDVKQEQILVLIQRLKTAFLSEKSLANQMTFESIKEEIKHLLSKMKLSGEIVAIRPGTEATLLLFLFLSLLALRDEKIAHALSNHISEIDDSLREKAGVVLDDIKLCVRNDL